MKLLPTILSEIFLLALFGWSLALILRVLTRFPLRRMLATVGAAILAGAFASMLLVQPSLQTLFRPDTATPLAIVGQRGWYPTQSDAVGGRYAWTQERATLVFDSLVHKPVTVRVEMRSAAVAGGPDAPVLLEVNGREVGQFRPNPTDPTFQRLSLRFVPHDWGGLQTDVRFVATSFKPGNGDPRVLGTMVKSVSFDESEAWSGIAGRFWLVWALPFLAALTLGLALIARWRRSAVAGYAAFATCCAAALCALTITFLIVRIGVVTPRSYQVWVGASCVEAAGFIALALALPFGGSAAPSLGRRTFGWLDAKEWLRPVRARVLSLRTALHRLSADRARREIARDLVLIFVIALGVRLVWVVVMPPWQATDETEHFAYANHIVEQHEIPHPPYEIIYGPASLELRQSLSDTDFYPLAENNRFYSKPESPLPIADYAAARDYSATGEARFDSGTARANPYPPLYYLFIALPTILLHEEPIISRLFAMRAATALLGALTCVFAYLFAFEIRRTRRWGWSLGLCLAFMPTFAQLGASVNNDTAVNLGSTIIIWLTVRAWQQQRLTRALAAALGLASGVTLLAKPTALPILVVAGIVVLIKVLPFRQMPRPFLAERLRAFGLYAATGLLSYGPWLLFRLIYYGNLVPGVGSVVRSFRGPMTIVPASRTAEPVAMIGSLFPTFSLPPVALFQYSLRSYLDYLRSGVGSFYVRWLFREFWGRLGWGGAYLPDSVLGALVVICVIGAVGLAVRLIRRRAERGGLLLLIGLVVLHVLFIFIGVDYLQSYARVGVTLGLQGRYFFPVLAPLLFLLLAGWESLTLDRAYILRIAPVLMLVLQFIGLGAVLTRYFGMGVG